MAIVPHTIEVPSGGKVVIYGETANINYFLNNDLEADTVSGVTVQQATVNGYTRRQYPGDATPISVSGSQREFLVDPTRSSGAALPGRPFILKEIAANGAGEKRQFTYTGRWLDLHAFLSSEAARPMYAYNNTGARSTIAATSAN